MLRTSYRRTALAGIALVASTALLTACQDGGSDSGGKKSSGSSSSEVSKENSGGTGGEGGDGTQARSGKGGKAGKGVSGTWFGNVEYLAPGKYTVSDMKGTKQQFFTSTDTDIQGAGEICGDANGQAATKCTEAQLEAASKKGVSAKVKLKNGLAVSIVEDHGGSGGTGGGNGGGTGGGNTGGGNGSGGKKGVNGTWFGTVSYLAPGKYTVSDMKDTKQQFFTSTDTDIQGAGEICGDAEGQAATKCTEADLEAASKKGVSAKVQIKDGIAVSIVEDHS
ncbi:lipoprotein [Streptomyces albiaxialis]|uniref:Lipoprotein n=1 Tax=Streptomyces albiaxialis TaxID=329523 RepID=A0ABN2WLL6_9ACTN